MVSGREAIKTFWSDLVQSINATAAVLASVDVMQAGEGVVEIGRATLTTEPQGQEDGLWKWHVDIWNQNS
jgi:hypothetical protein